jgi:superfamily I DNA/RNA helicase
MEGPVLLLAGPGTGKTYQLARRIQILVDREGVDPGEITVITFTREAARSMRAKLNARGKDEYLEPDKRPRNIMTMHALGHRIIEENTSAVGLIPGSVAVVDDKTLRAALMRDAALLAGFTEKDAKTALDDRQTANTSASDASKAIHDLYGKLLRACNAVDFDDQIGIACDILERSPQVLAEYRAMTRHLLVDEYQDINAAQHRFIRLLSGGQEAGLFAAGDDDQSIYGFRGGNPSYIRNFQMDYPGAKILQLQTSWRCLKNIVDCALSVVGKYDTSRVDKVPLTYETPEPGLVRVWAFPSDTREAETIAKAIYSKAAKGEAEDFFVLVPNRNYVKMLTHALTSKGIAHDVGLTTEKSSEWRALTSFRSWLQQQCNLTTRRVIELITVSGGTKMPTPGVRRADKQALRYEYASEIAKLWNPVLEGTATLLESLQFRSEQDEKIREIWELADAVRAAFREDDVPLFVSAIQNAVRIFPSIDRFFTCLEALEAMPAADVAPESSVRILTFQKSKGLEADCVFVIGLEEGSIPRDLSDTLTTAEEARLIFVAMTRAKKELHLSHARVRSGAATFKQVSRQLQPSVFVGCLPADQACKQYVQPKGQAKKRKATAP